MPGRWPLGGRWAGGCAAPKAAAEPGGAAEAEEAEAPRERLDSCNLGYALGCPRLPAGRAADRVAFALGRREDGRAAIQFAFEREHAPVACGHLIYDLERGAWLRPHADARLLRQAEAFLEAMQREPAAAAAEAGQLSLGWPDEKTSGQ